MQSTTMTIVYCYLVDIPSAGYYYEDICMILPLAFTMGLSGAYKKLTIYQPPERLISFPILFSVIGQGIIQAFGQV